MTTTLTWSTLSQPRTRLAAEPGQPRFQYGQTFLLLHPGADSQFVQRLIDLAPNVVSKWTIGGSTDDTGIGDPNVQRVIALRPHDWPSTNGGKGLREFFQKFYPSITFWPLDWENDFQLRGRLLAYSLLETGFSMLYPTTHPTRQVVQGFGCWQPDSETFHGKLDLVSSWFTWGDEVVSATDGVVVEAGWHGNQGGFGFRVRVKSAAPDGREVMIRYAPLTGEDGLYIGIGDTVAAGQKLGRPGHFGSSVADALHVEVQVDDIFVDPAPLIDWREESAPSALTPQRTPRIIGGEAPPAPGQSVQRPEKVPIAGPGYEPRPTPPPVEIPSPIVEPNPPTLVILPGIEDTVERLDWRTAAAIATSQRMWVAENPVPNSLPASWKVIAINPVTWGTEAQVWLQQRRQSTVETIDTSTPWEMAIQLLPALEDDIALGQTDRRWANYDFGEQPGVSGATIGRYGCFMTGLAIMLRKHYRRNVIPPMLDKLLVAARAAYFDDNMLSWEGAVPLFPLFDDKIKDNRMRSAAELQRLIADGWEIILRQADGRHFVYLEAVDGNTLQIIDTWDGVRKRKSANAYAGIRAAHLRPRTTTSTAHTILLVGLHDARGAEWLVSQGVEQGCCLVPQGVRRQPVAIDYTHLRNAGITVICRLNWGYADGTGTLPRRADKAAFVAAVTETMLAARGVDYFHIGNEPNNRQEWPGFGGGDEFPLTPAYVAEIYNEIWRNVAGRAKMGPPPIDPYFGPNSNSGEWWAELLERLDGADALFLHAKTQTNDPAEVWSQERFSDEPLTWQFLHLRTVETTLDALPDRFRSLPIYVTELNPQHLRASGGPTGWLPDNKTWVEEAIKYFRTKPIAGVVFYRFELAGDQASFALENKPAVLDAILSSVP